MKWYIQQPDGKVYVLKPQDWMTAGSLSFFIVQFNIFYQPGALFVTQDHSRFVWKPTFEIELTALELPYSFMGSSWRFEPLEEVNLHWTNNPDNFSRGTLYAVQKRMHLTMDFQLFTQKIQVIGPVSYRYLEEEKTSRKILLFGDIHDDLSVEKLGYTAEQVSGEWRNFFGSNASFYDSKTSFEEFETRVTNMKMLYDHPNFSNPRLELFIWEFLVLVLHMCSMEAEGTVEEQKQHQIDVIVEDMREMDFAPSSITNYLLAVRYLFSICPEQTTNDSPFAKFLPECHQLFPNLRYHRADLRYSLEERPQKGGFHGDTPVQVFTSLRILIMYAKQDKLDRSYFNLTMANVHGLKPKGRDNKTLWKEVKLMLKAMKKAPGLFDRYEAFLDVCAEAVQAHFEREVDTPEWFLFRTTVTDIYGLATLLGSSNKKSIVYVGDYHAKIWSAVLTQFRDYTVSSEEDVGQDRVVTFPSDTTKPLMTYVHWEQESLETIFDRVWPPPPRVVLQTKRANIIQFFEMVGTAKGTYDVSSKSDSLAVVPYLRREFDKGDPLQFRTTYPYRNMVIAAIDYHHHRKEELQQVGHRCEGSGDIFGNEFESMTLDQLKRLYVRKDGSCFSAKDMYKWWQTQSANGQVFRDPITRQLVSDEEQETILKLLGETTPPARNLNMYIDLLLESNNQVVLMGPNGHRYFLTWLPKDLLDQDTFDATFEALRETVAHANNLIFDLDNLRVQSDSIHFNNYQNQTVWSFRKRAKETVLRLQEELLPYSSLLLSS